MKKLLKSLEEESEPKYREWVLGCDIFQEIKMYYERTFEEKIGLLYLMGLETRIDSINRNVIRLMEEVR